MSRTAGLFAATGFLAATVVALLVAPAFACTPAGGGRVVVYPTTVAPGATVKVWGYQMEARALVQLYWGPKENSDLLWEGNADLAGEFEFAFTVPAYTGPNYQLNAYTQRTDLQMAHHQETMLRPSGVSTTTPTSAPVTPPPTTRPAGPPASNPPPTVASGTGGAQQPSAGAVGLLESVTRPDSRAVPAPPGPDNPAAPAGLPSSSGLTPAALAADESGAKPNPDDIRNLPIRDADVWAGLDAGRPPSLLDPPPASPGGSQIGPIMLGGGAALLATLALGQIAGRRRLARARY